MTFKTNSSLTTKSMTEWYFGKKFVAEKTTEAKRMNKKQVKPSSASGRAAPDT